MAGSVGLDIELRGNAVQVESMLKFLFEKLSPPAMTVLLSGPVNEYLQERATIRFDQEGDKAVGKWTQLKEATVRIREEKGFPGAHPINVRTGDLKNFITNSHGTVFMSGSGTMLRFPGDLPSGELEEKMRKSQVGDQATRTVARPVLGIDEDDLLSVVVMLAHWLGGRRP